MKKKKYWVLIVISIIALFLIAVACMRAGWSKEAIAKRALKKKYKENFVIHEIDSWGLDWEVIASPQNNPEVLFHSRILPEGKAENDDYYQCYIKYLLKSIIEDDLKELYPDSFFRMSEVFIRWDGDEDKYFRNMTIEEIFDNSEVYEAPGGSGCHLDIYINRAACNSIEYEREYDYFTQIIDEYIKSNKMLPITVTFFYVNHDVINNLNKYFQKDIDIDYKFETEILKVKDFQRGIVSKEKVDWGSPPNVTVCFKKENKNYIGNYENYKKRRALLENE